MGNLSPRMGNVKRYAIILLGSVLYAAAISLFLDPNRLAPGGVSGIAIILNALLGGIPTGTWVLCLNIPLMLLGVWRFGLHFFVSTIVAIVLSSVAIDLLAPIGALTAQPLLAAGAGGALLALGMGLILKVGATTGGTDIIVRLLKRRFAHLPTGRLFLLTDAIVITASAFAFSDIDTALYAAVAAIVSALVLDLVLYGTNGAKLVYIIAAEAREQAITARILCELEVGVTYLKGIGAYTNTERQVILCAVRKPLLPHVQKIALEEDPSAFLIVTSAGEIFGEGFQNLHDERV